jgi:hypothetical protein
MRRASVKVIEKLVEFYVQLTYATQQAVTYRRGRRLRVLASCTDIIGSVTDLGDHVDAIISIETSSARIQTQLSARNPSFSQLTMSFRRKPKTSSGHTPHVFRSSV